jgi:hypothetical protein
MRRTFSTFTSTFDGVNLTSAIFVEPKRMNAEEALSHVQSWSPLGPAMIRYLAALKVSTMSCV